MQPTVYSAAGVAIDAFEVEIEVHAGRGNTDKAALDSPVNKQQRQGELDNECKRDSTIADANHDDRIGAEHQERPDLSEGRGFHPSRALWQIDRAEPRPPGQDITKVPVSMLDG